MYPYIDLFGRQISTYALLVIAGLLTCGFVASFLGKKRGVEYESVIFMILSVSLGMFIGAHIVFAFTNMPQIIELFSKIGSISAGDFFSALGAYVGGMVFYGGFLGAVAAVAIYSKFSKVVARPVAMDLLSICIPLFHIFGRVGCFLTGCCYGFASESGLPTHHYIGEEVYIVNRFPVQLVEAAGNLLIFFIIMYLYRKDKFKGKLLPVYIVMYAPMRFVLEFFRGDTIRGFIFGLSTSQFISVILLGIVIAYCACKLIIKKTKKEKTV